MSTYPDAHAKVQKSIFEFSSQEIGSNLLSSLMIFEALHSGLFRFKFRSLSSKIAKIPGFNLVIGSKFAFKL